VSIAVLMMASCEPSRVADNSPFVKIPDLPSNVYGKRTKLPSVPADASLLEQSKIAKNTLKEYEFNERHNLRAISSSQKHNKFIQEKYRGNGGVAQP
jgi:hypothetical protein